MEFDFITQKVCIKDGPVTIACIIYDDDKGHYVLEAPINVRLTADQLREITLKLDLLNKED